MIYAWLIITAFLLLFGYILFRDFISPLLVSGLIWMAVYVMLIVFRSKNELTSISYGIFAGVYASFFVGFLCMYPRHLIKRKKVQYSVRWNPNYLKLIYIVLYVFAILWSVAALGIMAVTKRTSIWTALRGAMETDSILSSGLMGVVQNMIIVFSLVTLGMLLCNPVKENKKSLLLSLPPLIMVILLSPRGTWAMLAIAIVFMIIILRRPKNKKVFLMGIAGVLLFIIVFIISSFDKYSNAWTTWSDEDKLEYFMTGYFLAPPINYVNWIDHGFELENGKYIFRFICAILERLGMNIEVVNTVQPFTSVNGVLSNVYTALHWYTIDFGIFAAFVVEFLLGIFYAKIYKNVRTIENPGLFSVVLFSLMMFPIIIQFFSEQLSTITSAWIQRIIWLWLFTKTNLCWYGGENNNLKGKANIRIKL